MVYGQCIVVVVVVASTCICFVIFCFDTSELIYKIENSSRVQRTNKKSLPKRHNIETKDTQLHKKVSISNLQQISN